MGQVVERAKIQSYIKVPFNLDLRRNHISSCVSEIRRIVGNWRVGRRTTSGATASHAGILRFKILLLVVLMDFEYYQDRLDILRRLRSV